MNNDDIIWTKDGANSRAGRNAVAVYRFALTFLAVLAFATPPARAAVTEAWVQRYNGPVNGHDEPAGLVVDGSGNVIVSGSSRGTNGYNFYTAKYAGTSGMLLWEKRYTGPAKGGAGVGAVAVDGSGNVVVTGITGHDTNSDFYTVKYAAADGALLWEKQYASSNPVGSVVSAPTAHCFGRSNTPAQKISATSPGPWPWTAAAT